MTPLFTPEQLKGLHEVQSQAPHLYAQVPRQSIWQPGLGNRSPEEVKQERPHVPAERRRSGGECFHRRARRRGHHHRHWWAIMYQMTNDVDDQENHGYLKYKSPESDSDGQQHPQPREQSVAQIQGNGPGGRGLHVPRGFGQTGPPGYIMPHEERRGPMPHQGGWQVQLHPYGPGPAESTGDDDYVGDV